MREQVIARSDGAARIGIASSERGEASKRGETICRDVDTLDERWEKHLVHKEHPHLEEEREKRSRGRDGEERGEWEYV